MSINRMIRMAVVTVVATTTLVSCATNPVTGRRELALVSESQEIQMGREYSAQVVASIGLVQDQALQSYVRALGMRLAQASERPNLPWEFHVVDDAAVNAFAIPGGFIFVTRGLMSHLMNEAELVSVLGHENGHVTARHSVQQMSRAQLAQIGLGVGSILSPTVAQYGDIAGAGLGVLFLKFGRDDELQADDLGFKYMLNANYDPREMVSVFQMLARQGELAGGGKLPEWQSTHPDPGNRIRATEERVAAVTRDLSGLRVGEADYLARIDGMIFGENPRLGYFEGRVFNHPDLAFRFEFPANWQTQNRPEAVVGISAAQDAIIQLGFAQGSATQAAEAFFSQQGIQAGTLSRGSVNGLTSVRAEFAANTEGGAVRGIAAFVEYGGRTYQLLSYTPQEKFGTYANIFNASLGSFARLTDARALATQPNRIKVERAPRAMTLAAFHQQFPSVVELEQIAVINGLQTGSQLTSGQLVKRVVR